MSRFRHIPFRTLLTVSGIALGLYWLTLFVMTHIPPEILFSHFSYADQYLDEGGDKTMHLLAYAGLAFLFTSWLWIRGVKDHRMWRITVIVLCGYAVADELLQIPFRRSADFGDCVADWAGIAIGSLCFLAARRLLDRFGFRHNSASVEVT